MIYRIILLLTVVLLSSFFFLLKPISAAECIQKASGDADCNNVIDLVDFELWRKEFTKSVTTVLADFNFNGISDITDFEIWRKGFYNTDLPSPTSIPTRLPTSSPTNTATPTNPINSDPIIFFQGDLVSSGTVAKATKVVNLIKSLMAQHPGTTMYVATTGDNEQESVPTLSDYQNYFGTTYGLFVNQEIFKQVRGNHDVQDTGHGAAYATYFGSNSHLNSDGQTNYSYDLGTWHIIGLDQLNETVNSKTLTFLKADLASHTSSKCQIVYWHVPTYSSGGPHGDAVTLKPLNQAEYDYGVDIQINGHNHHYQRFYPINPDGMRDDAKGITTFIAGIGGQNGDSGTVVSAAEAASIVNKTSFPSGSAIGTVMFTLHSNSADYVLYDANTSAILDQGTVNCH